MTVDVTESQQATESADDDVVLQVRDVKKYFPLTQGIVFKRTVGHVKAVDGVSFELKRGETLGVVGESGCGKSTLGRLLMGLERPTDGSIKILGEEMAGLSTRAMRRMRRNIQIVLQDPYSSLDPRMTVGDIVGEPFEIHTEVLGKKDRRGAVQDLLDVVGLNPDHINRYPHQFSGGQRQRIGIARSLALRPKILVCDEPVSALDVSVQAQVINLLEELQDEFELTYLVIAHDLAVVRHISDRIGVMYLGGMVEEATADDLYAQPLHPYTRALLSAVPVPDPTVEDTREQILLTGDLPSPSNPPTGCRFHTRCPWRQPTRCDEERPELRVVDLPGVPAGHRVACHWAEAIERGEITPHEVAPVLVTPDDDGLEGDPFAAPATVTEVL